tara:strand:- start:6906 stop:7394 length:489 start_codon:yes stop_codon:yes gene_type:complete
MSEHIPIPKGFRPIPKAADHFVVSENGFVFNLKTGRLLKQHWNGFSTYTIIRDKEGNQYRFCYANIDRKSYKPLTREWVLESDKAKIIPDYPDYAVSHYGAVYRIKPRDTGPRAGEVFMVSEYGKQGHAYVRLRCPKTKKPREVRVGKLTEQLWGDESTYEC